MESKKPIKIVKKKGKNRIKKSLVFGTLFILASMIFSGMPIYLGAQEVNDKEDIDKNEVDNIKTQIVVGESKGNLLNSDNTTGEWRVEHMDLPTGTPYLLHEHFGGYWSDAEKEPGSDGNYNPPPVNAAEEDDELCWAATASNMLEYTGWGFIGGMEHDDTDDFFQYFQDHTVDLGYYIWEGCEWWFNGVFTINSSIEDVAHNGFWPSEPVGNYVHNFIDGIETLPTIRNAFLNERAVGLGVYPVTGPGGHAITCWGFNYNATLDPVANKEDYYLGVWVTDSDSHKGWADFPNPPDVLRYYAVDYNASAGHWYIPNFYGTGWFIGYVSSLDVFPNNQRPVADVANTVGTEGTAVTFDASGSSDPDGDSLEYRWDFDGDAIWDTAWSASATATHTWNDDYSGNVYLEVFDGRLRDIDIATVIVNNVAPTISVNGATINENGVATVSGTISDPGTLDTFTLVIDWGEGAPQTYNYPAGTSIFSLSHQYLDDDPTGTVSDDYSISISVTDDDGGMDTDTTIVTVNNVAPTISLTGDIINENEVATVSGTISDPGTLDTFTLEIDWGEGAPQIITYPAGTSVFSLSHQYLDDNPSGTAFDVYTITVTLTDDDGGEITAYTTVTVYNVAPTVTIDGVEQIQDFDLEELTIVMLEPATFTGSATDPGTDDLTFTWDWGDGTPVTSTFYPYAGTSVAITDIQDHVYTEPGEYLVTLTVEDDDLGISYYTITVKVLGPRDLKEMVISDLETLLTGDFCSDLAINHMIKKLECSLCDKLWVDEIHLSPRYGTLVFCYEMYVTGHMEKTIAFNNCMIPKLEKMIECLENKGYDATHLIDKVAAMQETNAVYESAILKLVKADELLARVALEEAENTPVSCPKLQKIVDYKLAKANSYLLFALECIENGEYTKALIHFKHSWISSQCAIKLAK